MVYINKYVESSDFSSRAPNASCSVTPPQNHLIFARVENFIDTFSQTIEHPQPRCSGAVDGVGNGDSFALPPSFLGFEHIAVMDVLKPVLQKANRGPEGVEIFHFSAC